MHRRRSGSNMSKLRGEVARPSYREKIITEGLRVVHERGFAGSSVRDIVQAAGVPQGSFTNHFQSKGTFGLEVLNTYYEQGRELTKNTLLNDSASPTSRLRAWVDGMLKSFNQNDQWNGCLLGNLGAEHSEGTDLIQQRVGELFLDVQQNIAYCLKAAVKAGELPASTNCKEWATFIHTSLEGAVLGAKATRSHNPMKIFRNILFSQLDAMKPNKGPESRDSK
jgi:TetR/AcrR family transcriptional regulator, transcriptional repressor for nem operon